MPTLIMTKGLPASGKSTWAKQQVVESKGKVKRVNKDDLRAMIDDSLWSKENEKNILAVRDHIVKHYLSNGFTVIVDDTNLSLKHEENLEAIAQECGAEFDVKSFLDVSLLTCIARNAARANPVPEKAIRSMYNQFLRPKVKPYTPTVYNPDLPNCIMVDIDGTLAHITDRSPYDYTKVSTDVVDEAVREILWRYSQRDVMTEVPNTYIILLSGREDSCKEDTLNWLVANQIPHDELHMRQTGDNRKDAVIKEEIYNTWIKNRYNVRFVLDDRNRVVNMWRSLGLKVLQVAEGDF